MQSLCSHLTDSFLSLCFSSFTPINLHLCLKTCNKTKKPQAAQRYQSHESVWMEVSWCMSGGKEPFQVFIITILQTTLLPSSDDSPVLETQGEETVWCMWWTQWESQDWSWVTYSTARNCMVDMGEKNVWGVTMNQELAKTTQFLLEMPSQRG